MRPGRNFSETIHFRISRAMYEDLKNLAKKHDLTVSKMARSIVAKNIYDPVEKKKMKEE